MSEWIKCSDRMPEERVRVRIAGLCLHKPNTEYWTMEAEYRSDPDGWYDDEMAGDPLDIYPATHWMPLSDPPEVP